MEKLLTISVAAYNMEPYIRQCLDSLTDPKTADALEVFVVDDGGTDGTLEIAKAYEAKYPGTFHAVHKENGGYGSTVNYSIAHASGKYFKLLDGDDWYHAEGLQKLMDVIKKDDDPDLILNPYYKMQPDMVPEILPSHPQGWPESPGSSVSTDRLNGLICGMWSMTVKTAVIQGEIPDLPEHTLYTDQLFTLYALSRVCSIMSLDFPVYCYRIGRDGQSVSREARIRHYKETVDVMRMLAAYYSKQEEREKAFLISRICAYYHVAIKTMLLAPASDEMYRQIRELESWIKKMDPDLYRRAGSASKRIFLIRALKKPGYFLQAGKVPDWA